MLYNENVQCDLHRRKAEAEEIARRIKASKQAKRNAHEWLRRARAASRAGNHKLAVSLRRRAMLETMGRLAYDAAFGRDAAFVSVRP